MMIILPVCQWSYHCSSTPVSCHSMVASDQSDASRGARSRCHNLIEYHDERLLCSLRGARSTRGTTMSQSTPMLTSSWAASETGRLIRFVVIFQSYHVSYYKGHMTDGEKALLAVQLSY